MANGLPSYFHLHLVSDSTGETLTTIAKAASVQYAMVRPIEHVHSLVRTVRQLNRVLQEIEQSPGIVLYTITNRDLCEQLEHRCQRVERPQRWRPDEELEVREPSDAEGSEAIGDLLGRSSDRRSEHSFGACELGRLDDDAGRLADGRRIATSLDACRFDRRELRPELAEVAPLLDVPAPDVGVERGKGRALDDIINEMNRGAEGVKSTTAVLELATRHGVEMPLASFVQRVLYEGARPADLVSELMLRKAKPELHGMR